jgi:hypothetical protein
VFHIVVERDLHLLAVAALRMLHFVEVRLHPLVSLGKPCVAVHRRLRRRQRLQPIRTGAGEPVWLADALDLDHDAVLRATGW